MAARDLKNLSYSHYSDCLCVGNIRQAQYKVYAVRGADWKDKIASQVGEKAVSFAENCGFTAKLGQTLLLADEKEQLHALLGISEQLVRDPYVFGVLPQVLPKGDWWVDTPKDVSRDDVLLGFCLGAYHYTLKEESKITGPRLLIHKKEKNGFAYNMVRSFWLARDLINAPANILGPLELAQQACLVLKSFGAKVKIIQGAALTKAYPLVAHVGQGSSRDPCVVVGRWCGDKAHKTSPMISLVGKGVCFDSGGYDLKSSSAMLKMKKDMGGAATVLALARLIMAQNLPIRLELRLGCVENSVSGNAMRPLDVVRSRAGLSVEIGNTDAEGRLVLADLLYEAAEEKPDLLLDIATLTGAARIALGPDLPALFCRDDETASIFYEASVMEADPLWRLPLWSGYDQWLKSPVADISNVSSRSMAGAITAALFLERFVQPDQKWVHIDSYAWNDSSRPARPEGGEAHALRTIFKAVCMFLRKYEQS